MEVGNERLDFIMTNMLEDPYTEVLFYLVEVIKHGKKKNHPSQENKINQEKKMTRERRIRWLEKTRELKRRKRIE